MSGEITIGSKKIAYRIQYVSRKTLGIAVTPDMQVLVKAPLGAAKEKIDSLLKKRARWIMRQQEYFGAFHPKAAPKKYISGESHYYMGRQYRLKIIRTKKNEVLFDGRRIILRLKPKASAGRVLGEWYRGRAVIKFAEIAEPLIERFAKYNAEPASIHLQRMKSRWGSCTPGGKILLNPELIKAPKACIEYVIVHELCHLVHKNHSARFFDLQRKEMPDWEKWKHRLETLLA